PKRADPLSSIRWWPGRSASVPLATGRSVNSRTSAFMPHYTARVEAPRSRDTEARARSTTVSSTAMIRTPGGGKIAGGQRLSMGNFIVDVYTTSIIDVRLRHRRTRVPLRPYPLGAGILVKALLRGSFSLIVFGWAQVGTDLQPLIAILAGYGQRHGFT